MLKGEPQPGKFFNVWPWKEMMIVRTVFPF